MKHGNTTHGATVNGRQSAEYSSWCSMHTRCYWEKGEKYHRYGARGIVVCDRWLHSFENFLADMGPRPQGTTLDRIDNDGNYEPSNCRWATSKQQADNKAEYSRNSRILMLGGKSATLANLAREWSIKSATLQYRLDHGWPIEKAVIPPWWTDFRRHAHGC